jgi:hypothetical protein
MKLSLKELKKFPVEIILIVILVALLYKTPYYLKQFVNNSLGKLILLSLVILVTHCYGITSGVISSLIVLLLLHSIFEGMENPKEDGEDDEESEREKSEVDSDADEDETDNSVDDDEDGEEDDTDESKNIINSQSDLLDLNPGDLRNNKDGHIANPDIATNKNVSSDEPAPVQTAIKEGFAMIN